MAFRNWLFARFRHARPKQQKPHQRLERQDLDTIVRAHGHWIALLATILERENIISRDHLARSLREFADVTIAERRPEGHILASWAAYLTAASEASSDTCSFP